MQEGIIKFKYRLLPPQKSIDTETLALLNHIRYNLKKMGLIGVDDNGVSFGNISIRDGKGFWITASGTGGIHTLTPSHLVFVSECNIYDNMVVCRGDMSPSSETLTHFACYDANPDIGAVIHVHSSLLWERWIGVAETTPSHAQYGTPDLALAIRNILLHRKCLPLFIVMGGHKDGIISAGTSLIDAFNNILNHIEKINTGK